MKKLNFFGWMNLISNVSSIDYMVLHSCYYMKYAIYIIQSSFIRLFLWRSHDSELIAWPRLTITACGLAKGWLDSKQCYQQFPHGTQSCPSRSNQILSAYISLQVGWVLLILEKWVAWISHLMIITFLAIFRIYYKYLFSI